MDRDMRRSRRKRQSPHRNSNRFDGMSRRAFILFTDETLHRPRYALRPESNRQSLRRRVVPQFTDRRMQHPRRGVDGQRHEQQKRQP